MPSFDRRNVVLRVSTGCGDDTFRGRQAPGHLNARDSSPVDVNRMLRAYGEQDVALRTDRPEVGDRASNQTEVIGPQTEDGPGRAGGFTELIADSAGLLHEIETLPAVG